MCESYKSAFGHECQCIYGITNHRYSIFCRDFRVIYLNEYRRHPRRSYTIRIAYTYTDDRLYACVCVCLCVDEPIRSCSKVHRCPWNSWCSLVATLCESHQHMLIDIFSLISMFHAILTLNSLIRSKTYTNVCGWVPLSTIFLTMWIWMKTLCRVSSSSFLLLLSFGAVQWW